MYLYFLLLFNRTICASIKNYIVSRKRKLVLNDIMQQYVYSILIQFCEMLTYVYAKHSKDFLLTLLKVVSLSLRAAACVRE